MAYQPKNPNGQAVMASSEPVVIASNQTAIPVSGTVALSAGSAAIGKLVSNTGVDIGDVDVTSIVPGVGATNLGKQIDSVAGFIDTGVAILAIRDDALTTIAPTDGDYAPFRVNSEGRLWTTATIDGSLPAGPNNIGTVNIGTSPTLNVNINSAPALAAGTNNIGDVDVLSVIPGTGPTNLGKQTDSVAGSTDTGVAVLGIRDDLLTTLTPADGDYTRFRVNSVGRLWASATIDAALPAGTNNIGDVDVLSLPALPTGSNTIGTVNIGTAPTLTVNSHAVTNIGTFAVQAAQSGAWITEAAETLGASTAISALNGTVQQSLNGASGASATVSINSAAVGFVITPEASYDGGVTWSVTKFYNPINELVEDTLSNSNLMTGVTRIILTEPGATDARVRASSWTSGSASFKLSSSNSIGIVNLKSNAIHGIASGSYSQLISGYASTTAPTAVDVGDAARIWTTLSGAVNIADAGGSITVDAPVATPAFVRLSNGSAAVDTLPVSLASMPTTPVTGTFWQTTQPVSIATLPALPTGTNNIGDVDVLTLPALPTGSNTIGAVNIATAQTLATVTTVGTVTTITTANLAADDVHDGAAGTTAVMMGGYAYGVAAADNTLPVVSANADAARVLTNKNGAIAVVSLPEASAAYALTNATTTAYTTSLVVKASAGTIYNITGYNSKTTPQFIQVHDAASLPADAAVPKVIFYVSPLSNFSYDLGSYGRFFAVGIVICNSSTGPTKTIGAADCWFDVQYK